MAFITAYRQFSVTIGVQLRLVDCRRYIRDCYQETSCRCDRLPCVLIK